jgi:clan AA aspartic protease (TIGR02281 family)
LYISERIPVAFAARSGKKLMTKATAAVCALVLACASATGPAASAADAAAPERETVTILRPAPPPQMLVFHADGAGQFSLEAAVNDAPIRFLVDTGASLVTLNLADARTAGISPGELVFSGVAQTANGRIRFAPVILREIRIGPLAIDNVPAAVIETPSASVLGMSFLRRLKGFQMRGGVLTLDW